MANLIVPLALNIEPTNVPILPPHSGFQNFQQWRPENLKKFCISSIQILKKFTISKTNLPSVESVQVLLRHLHVSHSPPIVTPLLGVYS
jgi:hypothetical protein